MGCWAGFVPHVYYFGRQYCYLWCECSVVWPGHDLWDLLPIESTGFGSAVSSVGDRSDAKEQGIL